MQEWDQTLIAGLRSTPEEMSSGTLEYQVVGGMDGIGISKDGSAFARVDLVKRHQDETKVIVSGMFLFRFPALSHRLSYVRWVSMQDDFSESGSQGSESSSSETLGSQLVHPSVVSLDVDKTKEEQEDSSSNGPGMNI